jgi:hypothetical protein
MKHNAETLTGATMRHYSLLSSFALATLLGAGCAKPDQAEPPAPVADSATVARARAATASLGPELAGMLMTAMQEGGPAGAVAVCADSAQVRTARHSVDGLMIRRVGTRVRNPANAPDSLESRLLAYLEEQKLAGTMPDEIMEVAQTGPDGGWELRYLKPVMLQEMCATCHGARDAIPTAVQTLIAERYPTDAAVDYAPGDLRGAVAVRITLPK